MYLNRKFFFVLSAALCLNACSSLNGFLGFAPLGDRKDYVQARDLYSSGQYEQAIEQLSAYIYKTRNVKRREARAYRLLGMSYEQVGQLNKALEVYLEALEFHADNVPLLLAAAGLYQRTGLTDKSISLYQRALAEEPQNLEGLAGQAENYRTIGFYTQAREFYDNFFALNPQAPPEYRAKYADTFLNQRNYEQAFINITMALAAENSSPDFWLISAKANRGLGRMREALADIDIALSLSPYRRDLLAVKAFTLYEDGQYNASLETARSLAGFYPENSLALFIQALNLNALGQKQAAQKLLRQILSAEPDSFIGKTAAQWLQGPSK